MSWMIALNIELVWLLPWGLYAIKVPTSVGAAVAVSTGIAGAIRDYIHIGSEQSRRDLSWGWATTIWRR